MNRNTKQRQIIYDVVIAHKDHPNAETIYNDVQKIDPKISKGTVYRNLKILSELNLIKHIKVPGGDSFDYRLDDHEHIHCSICGRVFDSPVIYQKSADKQVEKHTGFKIVGHNTLFEGICPDCLNKFSKGGKNEKI